MYNDDLLKWNNEIWFDLVLQNNWVLPSKEAWRIDRNSFLLGATSTILQLIVEIELALTILQKVSYFIFFAIFVHYLCLLCWTIALISNMLFFLMLQISFTLLLLCLLNRERERSTWLSWPTSKACIGRCLLSQKMT